MKVTKSCLTFSGLLNALDGVGSATGQIFILTTNHRERLDPALIRDGRVDLHVEFGAAQPEQMRQLFMQFYPRADVSLAEKFETELSAALTEKGEGERELSMAAIQHYFILSRKRTAEDAAGGVARLMEAREARKEREEASTAAKEKTEKEKAEAKAEAAEEEADADGEEDEQGGSGVHVHLHLPGGSNGKKGKKSGAKKKKAPEPEPEAEEDEQEEEEE